MRSMFILPFVVLAIGTTSAADLQSGLKVGASAGYFKVKDCTGPYLNKSICYR